MILLEMDLSTIFCPGDKMILKNSFRNYLKMGLSRDEASDLFWFIHRTGTKVPQDIEQARVCLSHKNDVLKKFECECVGAL